jgi:hypothetical protein
MRFCTNEVTLSIIMAHVKKRDTIAEGEVSSTTVMILKLRFNERNCHSSEYHLSYEEGLRILLGKHIKQFFWMW